MQRERRAEVQQDLVHDAIDLVLHFRRAAEMHGDGVMFVFEQQTLVTSHERFTFYPALVQLAFGNCTEDDITFDLSTKFKELGIRVIKGEMIRINAEAQTAEIAGDDFRGDIAYDYVVFAMGRRLATEKVPGFFDYASHLLGISAATKFGKKVQEFRDGVIERPRLKKQARPEPVEIPSRRLLHRVEEVVGIGVLVRP